MTEVSITRKILRRQKLSAYRILGQCYWKRPFTKLDKSSGICPLEPVVFLSIIAELPDNGHSSFVKLLLCKPESPIVETRASDHRYLIWT